MLSASQEKLIRSLATKKGRRESGRCLVEGAKVIETAGTAVEFRFTREDTADFDRLVTTETPQDEAGVARIPEWSKEGIASKDTVIVLDGVQDPGNVGAMFRLCLGYGASLLLVESADPSSSKVIRSSVGAMFQVPWRTVPREDAVAEIHALARPVFRLEKRDGASNVSGLAVPSKIALVAGSEGSGISLPIDGTSVVIPHDAALESLNVGHAVAIALYARKNRE